MKPYHFAILSGDGIGPEIMREALKVLGAISSEIKTSEFLVGGAATDALNDPLPKGTLEGCKNSDAVLFGAIGGAKWDKLERHLRPESGLLRLRKELGLFANVRPIKVYDALLDASPLKKERIEGADFVIVRELISGIYFGEPRKKEHDKAYNTMFYTRAEIERIAKYAFELAQKRQKRLCCVDKANVLETSVLWREVVGELAAQYPQVAVEFLYVDNASMQIILNPRQFDVLLCENLFGDILSDEASVIGGSIGLLASASVGESAALFEPIHGSAPDIAGQNKANPVAMILSLAMAFEHLGESSAAKRIHTAINRALAEGYRTIDIATDKTKALSCSQMGDLIARYVSEAR